MSTRILAAIAVLLAAFAVHQSTQLLDLRRELASAQARGVEDARVDIVNAMANQGGEIASAASWLNDYYKSPEGLQRPAGLSIDGHPDYEGIGVWIFGVYLPHRLKGESDEQARQAIVAQIQRSDEWQSKHRVER